MEAKSSLHATLRRVSMDGEGLGGQGGLGQGKGERAYPWVDWPRGMGGTSLADIGQILTTCPRPS